MTNLYRWLDDAEKGRPSEKTVAWNIRGLLFIFEDLKSLGKL